jgi:WS/DGAT/MGAT family acyltransferase
LAGAVGRDAATLVRLVLTPADAATVIKGDPGVSRRVAWTPALSLAQVKRIAHANDATVNDVLLAAVSGALRHYLQERGGPIAEIQALVPFNLRPLDEPVPRNLGNKFGLVFLPLPVGTSGSYRRLVEVHRRMQELKSSRDGAVSYGLLSVTGLTPEPIERRIIDMFTAKSTAVMTNVPGPREPVYVAGTPLRTVLFWAPTSGHMGMSVSIYSYRGEVTVGLMVDAALIPDPEEIVTQLEREVDALARLDHRRTRKPAARRRQSSHRERKTNA